MSIELFERILNKSMNLNCSSIIFVLFEVLEIILRNQNFIKNRNNFIKLLNKSNEAIVEVLKDKILNFDACKSFDLKKWKIATNFQKFLIALFEEHPKLLMNDQQFELDYMDENITCESTESVDLNKEDLAEKFRKLKYRSNHEYLNILNRNNSLVSISIENESLKNSHDELEKENKSIYEELQSKKALLNALQEERITLKKEIENMRYSNADKSQNVLKKEKKKKKKKKNNHADNCDTKEMAKQFIENLNIQNKNSDKFKLCKNLDYNLYKNPEQHFFLEIFQNFEDCSYDSKDSFFKVILDKDYILFCSNQNGFTKSDVEAVCTFSGF